MKYIIAALPLVFMAVTSVAQNAYSDLMNALRYSQNGPANAAFDGSGKYYNYHWGHNTSSNSRSGISPYSERRRSPTDMSKIGLKITYSGYNVSAERARRLAEQMAERRERIRREMERRERIIASYMAPRYEASQKREIAVKAFIIENSNAKPLSPEEKKEIISNGLSGNFIIDDDGDQYFLPENLLEGAGEIHEINGEEFSDEELDFLLAQALERKAELEEEIRQMEDSLAEKWNDKHNFVAENIDNQSDGKNIKSSLTDSIDKIGELNVMIESSASMSSSGTLESLDKKEEEVSIALPSNLEESIEFLPEGCTYTVLLQPSRTMKSAQMVYGEGYTSPLLRNEGKLFKLSNNEIEELTAYRLPKEIGNGESVFILNNQLICKCGSSVKCHDSKSMKELFSLTDVNFNIYPAFDGKFYLVKYKADSSFVYLFDTQTKKFTKQFDTPFQIENLAGTGLESIVTSGKLVYHASTEVQAMGEITGSKVQSVAFISKGIFLSNEKACYCMDLSGKSCPFMVSSIKQVMMLDDRLYLLFEDGMLSVIDNANKILTLLDKENN